MIPGELRQACGDTWIAESGHRRADDDARMLKDFPKSSVCRRQANRDDTWRAEESRRQADDTWRAGNGHRQAVVMDDAWMLSWE